MNITLGRVIPPVGSVVDTGIHGKIYILGEAPGEKEDRAGQPFIGGSGHLLFSSLQRFGVLRKNVRIANVFWQRPPANRISVVKDTVLFEQYSRQVRQDIEATQPDVIIALGATALECLTGETSIKSARGYWTDYKGIPVLPTYHPAAVLRDYQRTYIPFLCDLKKAVLGSKKGKKVLNYPKLKLHIDDFDTFQAICKNPPSTHIALDIEVDTKRMVTTIIGLAWDRNKAVNISLNPENVAEATHLLHKLCLKRGVELICHNAAFELQWLYMLHQLDIGLPHDTMIMHHLLLMEQDKSLGFCASIWLDVPRWKYLSASDQLTYNALDCTTTWELFGVLEKELKESNLWNYYLMHKRRELRPAVHASTLGLELDREALGRLVEKNLNEQEVLLSKLKMLTGEDFNPNSPVQLKKLLYDIWQLPVQKEKGKISTGANAIKKLVRKTKNPAYREWLKTYQEWKKLSSLYSKELKIEPDPHTGRIHTGYNVAGTASSRWSSSKLFFLSSTNLQNRNKKQRIIFRPPIKNWVFVARDYSGAEARVVAYRCNDTVLMEAFEKGMDIHKLTASLMFGKSIEEIDDDLRQIGKRMRHAGNYDMSWKTVADQMEISAAEAKTLLNRYHAANPKIRNVFHAKTREIVMRTRSLINPFGLVRVFSGRITDNETFRQAYAFYPQSTVTDALNKSIVDFYDWTEDKKWVSFCLQVHDEAIAICEPEAVAEVSETLRRFMEFPIPIECLETGETRELILPTDCKVGRNWGKYHPEDNPEGMREFKDA